MDPITIKYNNDLRLLICLGVAGWRTDKIDQTVTKMITEKINNDPEFQSQKIYLFSCPFIMLKPLMTMHHMPNQCNGCQFIKLSKLLDQLDNLLYKSLWGLIRRDTNTARYTQQQSKGGGCLIATAAFGSEMAPQVQFLREIRDNTVLQTELGTSFMTGFNQFYYSFSPYIADYERENPAFKETVKIALTPLLTSLTLLQYADIDSESEMLGYGIVVILLNIGMYFVAPAVLIMKVRKKIS